MQWGILCHARPICLPRRTHRHLQTKELLPDSGGKPVDARY
ncbi:hypothetical protein [Pseudomonas paraveronii]|nr:hypothetical protein [Pseudomonas sp. FLM 11]